MSLNSRNKWKAAAHVLAQGGVEVNARIVVEQQCAQVRGFQRVQLVIKRTNHRRVPFVEIADLALGHERIDSAVADFQIGVLVNVEHAGVLHPGAHGCSIVRLTGRDLQNLQLRAVRLWVHATRPGGGSGLFENVAAVEMALVVEVVVDRGVERSEFLKRFRTPEFRHCSFSSPEGLM